MKWHVACWRLIQPQKPLEIAKPPLYFHICDIIHWTISLMLSEIWDQNREFQSYADQAESRNKADNFDLVESRTNTDNSNIWQSGI